MATQSNSANSIEKPPEPLNEYETFWHENETLLLEHGYMLRPRYRKIVDKSEESVARQEPPLYTDFFSDPVQTVRRTLMLWKTDVHSM